MHMIRKGQLNIEGVEEMSFADQFSALAGQIRPAQVWKSSWVQTRLLKVNATEPVSVKLVVA